MINKYFKTIGSILLVGAFLFLAFGSDDTKSSDTSPSSNSKKTRTVYSGGYAVEIDLTPPAGCTEGATCSGCDGSGVTNYLGNDMICPSCNGKGFLWLEKKGLSQQPSDISEPEYSNENQTVNREYDSTNSNRDSSENSNINKSTYRIYNLNYSINYIDAESKCKILNMRLPDYEELLEVSNSPELMKNLTTLDENGSYWSSTDYIDGDPFDNKESIRGDDSKKFKKNYNPFYKKTIMTDTRLTKNCFCIEKLDDNIYRVTN
jgi:hypothetical protein